MPIVPAHLPAVAKFVSCPRDSPASTKGSQMPSVTTSPRSLRLPM